MAVSLAEHLRSLAPDSRVLFVGTERGLEERILAPLGYPWKTVRIGGLNRVGPMRKLRSVFQLPGSLLASRDILKSFRPDVTIGLGGYSSFPVAAASRWLRIPLVLLEPNVLPGMANRWLRSWCCLAAVAFRETAPCFGDKAMVTGVPVRAAFHAVPDCRPTSGRLRLLIVGGSQGSRGLNDLVLSALPKLSRDKLAIAHQTGKADLARMSDRYRQLGWNAEVVDFIDDMPARFAQCDVVMGRAGACTVAEIAAAGRASLLVPLPTAADNHQERNAQALADRGAALTLPQAAISGRDLASLLHALADNPQRVAAMGVQARAAARPDSVEAILRGVAGIMTGTDGRKDGGAA